MSEETESRTETTPDEPTPFVALSEQASASVVPDDETLESPEATDAQAEEAAAEETEGEETELLTAEEAGVDEDSPEYKALRKKFIAAYQKKLEAERKKLKAEQPEQAAPEPAKQAEAAQGSDPIDEVYKIDFDSYDPTIEISEDSDLYGYKDELKSIVRQAVLQGIQHTLDGVKSNDMRLRQQMTVAERNGRAQNVISEYAKAISDHPDFEEKASELAAYAERTKAFAIEDPEEWVAIVERKFGLDRNWRDEVDAETAQKGAAARQTATKLRAVVPRPSTAARLNGTPTGKLRGDDAFEAAWRSARGA